MAVEHWAPFAALRIRLLFCGHAYDADPQEHADAKEVFCQVCQKAHPGPGSPDADTFTPLIRIPTNRLTWDGLTRQKIRKTHRRKHEWAPIESLDQLLAELSAGPCRLDLGNHKVAPKHPHPDDSTFLVIRACSFGSTVLRGTIALPERAVLLLAGGGGANFDGVTFTGAAVVCTGENYKVAFRNCTFLECQLCIVHGAAATLRACTFKRCNPALTASGPGTLATLSGCTFSDCPCAILAEAGAAATADGAAVNSALMGAIANGLGSRINLAAATIHGGHCAAGTGSSGVIVQGGAAALLGCTIQEFTVGLSVRDTHASLEVHVTKIARCAQGLLNLGRNYAALRNIVFECESCENADHADAALTMQGGAKLLLEQCRVDLTRGEMLPCPAMMIRDHTAVAMKLCEVYSRDIAIAAMGFGSQVKMDACSVVGRSVAVTSSGEGCTLCAADCAIVGMQGACAAFDNATATFSGTRLTCQPGSTSPDTVAVHAKGASTVRLLRCMLMYGRTGLRVEDHSSVVSVATDVSVPGGRPFESNTGYACVNSLCEVRGGSVSGRNVGALVQGTCTTAGLGAAFHKLLFDGCTEAVRVESTAAARSDVAITGGAIQKGGCGVTVVAENKSEVVVVVEGCSMQGNSEGVLVSGAFADVTLRKCDITLFEDGVTLRGAGVLHMHDVNVLTAASGVAVGCAPGGMLCWACGLKGAAAEAAAWAAAHASGGRAVAGARCVHEGGIARLTMERVAVQHIECGEGIVVGEFGHLTATDCRVEGCGSGIEVAYIHQPSRFERCTVVPLPGEPGTQFYQLLSPSDDGGCESEGEDDIIEGVEVMGARADAPTREQRHGAQDARGIANFL